MGARQQFAANNPAVRQHRYLLVAAVLAAAVLGWILIEGEFLLWLDEKVGFETATPRTVAWALLAVGFGSSFGLGFPRYWYLAPLAGSSLDVALMLWGFAHGGGNLWPIAVAIRLAWILLALGGAFLGLVFARRHRERTYASV
jgi:hypothetical protein